MSKPNVDISNYKRLTVDKLCTEGCINILTAFLTNLTEDFRLAYYSWARDKNNVPAKEHYMKLRDLFCSGYFYGLTGINGKAVVEKLEAGYREELQEMGA